MCHNLGLWFYWNSPTIQAVCQILGILGLACYAMETYKIRGATITQNDASRRPFFEAEHRETGVHIKNTGSGVALKVEWRQNGDSLVNAATKVGAIAPGSYFIMKDQVCGTRLKTSDLVEAIRVSYTDTAGKRYWSEIQSVDQYHFRTDTGNESPPSSWVNFWTAIGMLTRITLPPKPKPKQKPKPVKQ